MKVSYIAQQTVGLVSGGPAVQVSQTRSEVEKLGVQTALFDQWDPGALDGVDLVHLFGASFLTFDVARRLREFGVPYVVSPIFFSRRSPASIRLSETVVQGLSRLVSGVRTELAFAAEVCRDAALVLPNTSDEAGLVREGFGVDPSKIQIVPNGVEPRFAEATDEEFLQRYGLEDFLLNVGHIGSGRKNTLNLVRSVKDLDVDLVLIGKIQRGDYAAKVLAEAETNPRVTVIDGIDHSSSLLASAYAAARLFALPSVFETPGIAALEAAAAGADILITPVGGTRDYFDELATYTTSISASSIQHGIESALQTSYQPELQERILSNYSWEQVGRMTLSAYENSLRI